MSRPLEGIRAVEAAQYVAGAPAIGEHPKEVLGSL